MVIAPMGEVERWLVIHAYASDRLPPTMPHVDVGVGEFRANVHSWYYHMRDVTGCSVRVQATMVAQANVARAVREAVICIETDNLSEFAFVCDGGMHRSTSCVLLLAMLAYYGAGVCFHTPRTATDLRATIDEHTGRQ